METFFYYCKLLNKSVDRIVVFAALSILFVPALADTLQSTRYLWFQWKPVQSNILMQLNVLHLHTLRFLK